MYPRFLRVVPDSIPGGVGHRAISYIFVLKELTHSNTTLVIANSQEVTGRGYWDTTRLLNVVHCPMESEQTLDEPEGAGHRL